MKKLFYKKCTEGFSLVEIMIVVAIIGLLAAIALPNFMRTRIDANENLVRADLRAFSTGAEQYRMDQNPPVYSPSIINMIAQNFLDASWNNPGNRHGYGFSYAMGNAGATYSLAATALTAGVSGINDYCVDQSGVVVTSPGGGGMGTQGGCVGGTPLAS